MITAIAVASLADQGLIKYGDPVANYIPEFASKPAVRKGYNIVVLVSYTLPNPY